MVQLLKSSSTSHDHQELQSDAAAAQDPVAATVAVTEESTASVMHIHQAAVASVAAAESDHVMHHIHVAPAAAAPLAAVASPKQLGACMSPLSEILVRARGLQNKNLAVTAAGTISRDGETAVSCTALVAALLTWKDLSVTVVGRPQALLQNISGYAEPGSIMAIMGPSGSGKSTMLDALAGRLSKTIALQTGEILLNGHSRKNKTMCNGTAAAYVTQSDDLIATLTVKEYLHYAADLRLPSSHALITRAEKREIVNNTIQQMGLQECANTHVGNWHLRGLSGGEKRRLSIALEILTRPRLLFLDEPTTGLDSAAAFFVVTTLRNLARDGRTVISSIHQPSSEVFELFDNLTLLSGGRCMYFGVATDACQHFATAGFPCPELQNPSDHYLRAVNTDFDQLRTALQQGSNSTCADMESSSMDPLDRMTAKQVVEILAEVYQKSDYAAATMSRIQLQTAKTEGFQVVKTSSRNWQQHGNFWTQCWSLTRRSFTNMKRDIGYYWLRSIIYFLLSICLGTIYWRVGFQYSSILGRAGCMAFVGGFLTFMSIGSFPSFVDDMKVFSRERMNGHYGVMVFVISNSLSSLPFLFFIAFVSGSIIYLMVQLHHGFDHYIYFVLLLFVELACADSLMMAVASMCPSFLVGILIGSGIQGVFLLMSGFFRLPNDLPKPVWRYPTSYLAFHMYAMQGMFKNDFLGLTFGSFILNGEAITPKIPGYYVVEQIYGIQTKRGKWMDLVILLGMIFMYRLLFLICIKLNEDFQPLVHSYMMQYRTKSTASKKIKHKKYSDLCQAGGVLIPATSSPSLSSFLHSSHASKI
ncbi:unnamed protein product [Sphagnum balticum]